MEEVSTLTMRIATAWHWDESDGVPELVAAYDEMTEDYWGKTPDFFTDALNKHDGEIRIATIIVSSDAIYKLFEAPTVHGQVEA